MKIRSQFGWAALAVLMFIPSAFAQGGSAPSKIGILNLQVAVTSTAEGKEAGRQLQAQIAPRQAEMETMRKQIEDIQTRLRNGASTLSDDEKQRLLRENDALTRGFQRKQQDYSDDATEQQHEAFDPIGRKLMEVVNKYGHDNGFALIVDGSSQNSPIVYADNAIDISQDIIRLFDQAYPVKAGGTTPKPASQRPAAKPAATEPPK